MPQYEQDELEVGFWITLLHEFRHQQMNCCPYEMAWLDEKDTSEDAVERWARKMYELLATHDVF